MIYVLATPLSLNKGGIYARMWALHAIANDVAHANVGVAGKGARWVMEYRTYAHTCLLYGL